MSSDDRTEKIRAIQGVPVNDYRVREIFNRVKQECGLHSSSDYPKRSPERSPAHRFMRLMIMIASDHASNLDSNFYILFEAVAAPRADFEFFVCLADIVCGQLDGSLLDVNPAAC